MQRTPSLGYAEGSPLLPGRGFDAADKVVLFHARQLGREHLWTNATQMPAEFADRCVAKGMCVSATARAALDLGFRTTVVANACATRDLPAIDGSTLLADEVHRVALAELADAFSIVVSDADALP